MKGRKLTPDEADAVLDLHENEGFTIAMLAAAYGVGTTTIWRLLQGERYKDAHMRKERRSK